MMRRTHAAAGLAIGFGLAGLHHQPILNAALLGLLTQAAALLPDLDIKLPFIKHRGVTHSLFALGLVSLGARYVSPLVLPYVALGYGSHLLLDLLTVWGIPVLWPVKRRFRVLKISTGGRIDELIGIVSLSAGVIYWLSIIPASSFRLWP